MEIDRRDFLEGVAVGAAGLGIGRGAQTAAMPAAMPAAMLAATPAAQAMPGYYPPLLTGLRGSHPGSFETAHALRDGDAPSGTASGESYDLVVIGAGISGLAAAWFWRAAHPGARILVLDNHDDFGGHAKRNEFDLGGKLHLMNGGTMLIDSPRPYSQVASGLLTALGIDPVALSAASRQPAIYKGLARGIFFDKATFGVDALVAGVPADGMPAAWTAFLARTPLSEAARRDVLRIETGTIDHLPGLDDAAKKDRLSRISYGDFLTGIAGVGPATLPYFQKRTHGEWATGIDAVSALDAWGFGLPGFAGMQLVAKGHPRMSFTPRGYVEGGSDTFHFPDGNASIARLLVRGLVPGAIPGSTVTDIVTARCDYSRLDTPATDVRIRLSSVAVNVRHLGTPGTARQAEVTYNRGGALASVRAGSVIVAGWNMMIPYLMPDLPAAQKAALHELVKAPLVYTSVALRNWRAFQRAGVWRVAAPGSYHSSLMLNWPVDIGGYAAERDPDKPILLFMNRTPCAPGLSEHDQYRAGRAELLSTPFATFETEIRDQLGAMFTPFGFDPVRDITGITVNRWPHGYSPEYNFLWQADLPESRQPHIIGRARFGRIAIANADSGGGAYTDVAIDQAWRAVGELA